jgi:hypothetical protein
MNSKESGVNRQQLIINFLLLYLISRVSRLSAACPKEMFGCPFIIGQTIVKCLPVSYKCNGRYDCPDYSDERGCSKSVLIRIRDREQIEEWRYAFC